MTKAKIKSLGKQKYSHSYRATNSTTSNFARVQPLMCRFLTPASEIKGSCRQFVRLAPMPWPTFGDIRVRTEAMGIPVEDVFPNWSAFLAEKTVKCYNWHDNSTYRAIPKLLPQTSNRQLALMLYSKFTATSVTYTLRNNEPPVPGGGPGEMRVSTPVPLSSEEVYDTWFKEYSVTKNMTVSGFVSDDDNKPSVVNTFSAPVAAVFDEAISKKLDKASTVQALDALTPAQKFMDEEKSFDYITFTSKSQMASDGYVTGYRLNADGKQLRKVLLGLGYNPSMDDNTRVSILPLIAYAKAYYDRFIPFRDKPFTDTVIYLLIQSIAEDASYTWLNSSDYSTGTKESGIFCYDDTWQAVGDTNRNYNALFNSMIFTILAKSYATQETNFISAHISQFQNGSTNTTPSYLPVDNGGDNNQKNTIEPGNLLLTHSSATDWHPSFPTDGTISAVAMRMIQKMYGYVNRNSLIGNRLDLYLRNHFDSAVYNEMFHRVGSCASSDFRISIGDIDSTADTLSQDESTGVVLGAYSGKGIGTGDLSFNYKAQTATFFIVFQWIDPVTDYYQGTDTQLFMKDKGSVPQAEFDALGYEITPQSAIFTDNGISLINTWRYGRFMGKNNYDADANVILNDRHGFGYIPRYSGFKRAKNIVNGDMSLRSKQSDMSAFYLDRQFTCRSFKLTSYNGTNDAIVTTVNDLPVASEEWKYIKKYPYMGNYDRIFYNSGYDKELLGRVADTADALSDNFFIHCVFDWTENNTLKPLSLSYDTSVMSGESEVAVTQA